MKTTGKKKKLVMEQNKILIIICVGFVIGIGVLGLLFYFPVFNDSKETTDSMIKDNGVVNDLDGIRGNK